MEALRHVGRGGQGWGWSGVCGQRRRSRPGQLVDGEDRFGNVLGGIGIE